MVDVHRLAYPPFYDTTQQHVETGVSVDRWRDAPLDGRADCCTNTWFCGGKGEEREGYSIYLCVVLSKSPSPEVYPIRNTIFFFLFAAKKVKLIERKLARKKKSWSAAMNLPSLYYFLRTMSFKRIYPPNSPSTYLDIIHMGPLRFKKRF